MDFVGHDSQVQPPLSPNRNPLSPPHTSFPIIAVAIIGILATAFLLVSYYVFVIKCCLNWHRIDLLRRFSFSRSRHHRTDSTDQAYSPPPESRGLNEAAIRSLPLFNFKTPQHDNKTKPAGNGQNNACECAVCLNEFRDGEKLRIIPNCAHIFHIDCIDVWLQNNANCPLCRTSISPNSEQFFAPNPQMNDIVIEIGDNHRHLTYADNPIQERPDSGDAIRTSTKPSWKKSKKLGQIGSMGDEWIETNRIKDEQFAVQPIRRSFSMDSAGDTQLCLAVQEIMQRHRQEGSSSPSEGSSKGKKSFFSFGQGKATSRGAVQPVFLEP